MYYSGPLTDHEQSRNSSAPTHGFAAARESHVQPRKSTCVTSTSCPLSVYRILGVASTGRCRGFPDLACRHHRHAELWRTGRRGGLAYLQKIRRFQKRTHFSRKTPCYVRRPMWGPALPVLRVPGHKMTRPRRRVGSTPPRANVGAPRPPSQDSRSSRKPPLPRCPSRLRAKPRLRENGGNKMLSVKGSFIYIDVRVRVAPSSEIAELQLRIRGCCGGGHTHSSVITQVRYRSKAR